MKFVGILLLFVVGCTSVHKDTSLTPQECESKCQNKYGQHYSFIGGWSGECYCQRQKQAHSLRRRNESGHEA